MKSSKDVYVLSGEINTESINACVEWIITENIKAEQDELTLYVNSQGGDIYEAIGLIDMMESSNIPVNTIGYGSIMSAGFMIFIAGIKRSITKNCGIMCHQFSSIEDVGKYHDIIATRKETDRLNNTMVKLIVESSNLDAKAVKSKLLKASDVYLTPEDLIEIKAADEILQSL